MEFPDAVAAAAAVISLYFAQVAAESDVIGILRVIRIVVVALLALGATASGADAQSWTRLGNDGGVVEHLLADPTAPGRLYATAAGIAVSDDAGRSWRPANAGLHATDRGMVLGLVADVDLPGRLYLVDIDGRLMRSDDAAQSWIPAGYSLSVAAAPFGRGRLPMADVPGSTTTLLLATSDGTIHKSSDSGATFTPLAYLGWTQRPITTIAVDPANPQHILVGFGVGSQTISGATLMRSTTGGATFQTVGGDPGIGSGSSVAFVPGGPALAVLNGRVHVSGTGSSWQSSGVVANRVAVAPNAPHEAVAMSATDCRRSLDFLGGSAPCDAGLPATGYARFTDLTVVADGTAFRAVATAAAVGVRAMHSSDSTWTTSNAGLSSRHMRGLAVVPGNPDAVFAGYWGESVYESSPLVMTSDGGGQWQAVLGDRVEYVRSLVLDPTTVAQPGAITLYAGGLNLRVPFGQPTRSTLYRSDDSGQNWVRLESGLPPGSVAGSVISPLIRRVALDPRSCAVPPALGYCRSGPLQRVFALTSMEGWRVLRSDQRGDNWVSGDAADSGLPRFTDDGNVGEAIYPIDIEVSADGDVFLSTLYSGEADDGTPMLSVMPSGVFRSSDGGLHWQQRSTGLPLLPGSTRTHPDVAAIAAHPRRAGVLWAAAGAYLEASRVYKTVDSGATWQPSGPLFADCWIRDLQVDAAMPEIVYAAGAGVGFASACVYRSEDGGANWARIGGNAPFGLITDLRLDAHDQSRLRVSTDQGIWELRSAPERIFIENFGN